MFTVKHSYIDTTQESLEASLLPAGDCKATRNRRGNKPKINMGKDNKTDQRKASFMKSYLKIIGKLVSC